MTVPFLADAAARAFIWPASNSARDTRYLTAATFRKGGKP